MARQLFGEQLAGLSGGKINSLAELVAAAQAGKEAAEAVPALSADVGRQAEAHTALLAAQKKQEEEIEALRRERTEMLRTLEANQRELKEQMKASQEEAQPMLRAIMARLGIASQVAGGSVSGSAMEVVPSAEVGGEEAAAGPSAAVLAGPGAGQGSRGEAAVVSEQVSALVPAGAAGRGGRQGRGEAPAAGLDQLLCAHRRAETRLAQCTARLESLRSEEQKAMGAEAQALEEQEVARGAAE